MVEGGDQGVWEAVVGANDWVERQRLERSVDEALVLVQERVLAADEFRSVMPPLRGHSKSPSP